MDPETTETIKINGMHCGHCTQSVRDALEGVEGLHVEDVEIGAARVRYKAGPENRQEIDRAIEGAGYEVRTHA